MIELIVAVSLMIVLLGVLAYVFKQSAETVEGATEAVGVIAKARNLQNRLGRELASAVEYTIKRTDSNSQEVIGRAFDIRAEGSTKAIEFVSQTLKDGHLDTWNVIYEYDANERTITRFIRTKAWALKPLRDYDRGQGEIIARPVDGVEFKEIGDREVAMGAVDENDRASCIRLPAAVQVTVTFLDRAGANKFPMRFYFPLYQGS
jgi:type II secretory pathway pseudopilin PulG